MSELDLILARSAADRGFVSDPLWGDDAARLGLRRTAAFMKRMGAPQLAMPVVHVAGSKGKGSTCAILAAILGAPGHRVGLATSPHLHTFRERIVVGGEIIGLVEFDALAARVDREAGDLERERPDLGRVTALELLLGMAMTHFTGAGCDVAVVETGIGGALDSTNVLDPAVSVIGPIELEHTAILGSTLTEIAVNKAGIIKPGKPVAVAAQPEEVLAVIVARASEMGSPVSLSGRDWRWSGSWRGFTAEGPWGRYEGLRSGLAGEHQVANACLALAASALLPAGLRPGEWAVREGFAGVRVPGRFERVDRDGRAVVLDGAHTAGAARALATTLGEVFPDQAVTLVIGMAADKDVGRFTAALAPVAGRVIATRSASVRAMDPERIAATFAGRSVQVDRAGSVAEALSMALGSPGRWTADGTADAADRTANGVDARSLPKPAPRSAIAPGSGGVGPVVITGSLATVAEARVTLGLPGSEEHDG
ncbi:MAG: cyanophycin synthetase [Thermomicrobiales bacterium]